ncbi:hypothetical protein [Hymenobacter norwichensis]|uniref:hypothetical protein n=1 Tax=Hymenobacter norwichensis TaxID=223903 RepID=UPI0003B31BBB|nr:hypothetical protein [Hymenobacter norwichensis]
MEAFKITLFEQEHAQPFPSYRSLLPTEGRALQARLARQFGLTASHTANEFEFALASRQTYYHEVNAEQDFALLPTLTALGITPLPELFINWARFEEVDTFQTADVAHYFDDLWYPVADNIDLFDASLRWVVSIRHDGVVSAIR